MKKKVSITALLLVVILLLGMPNAADSSLLKSSEYSLKYEAFTANEIYVEEIKKSGRELLDEIMGIEGDIHSSEDEIGILPSLYALAEKGSEFTESDLYKLLKNEKSGDALDEALVHMLLKKKPPKEMILDLIEDSQVGQSAKTMLVTHAGLNSKELSSYVKDDFDGMTVSAMKRLCVSDPDKAFEISSPILKKEVADASDEQKTAACLGFAEYYENQSDQVKLKLKEEYWPLLKEISKERSGAIPGDQAVYAMIRMRDYDVLRDLLIDDPVDRDLKISAIDSCYKVIIQEIQKCDSVDDVDVAIESLKIIPIIDIAVALKEAVESGQIKADDELMMLIDKSIENGTPGVNKYE